MKNLEWREYMRELLKMSDVAIMKTLGTSTFHRDLAEKWACGVDFAWTDGVIMDTPNFRSDRSCYTEITPKIKVGFECEKPRVNEATSSYSVRAAKKLFISGTKDGLMHEATLIFPTHEEQEKVLKQLISAFGG